MVMTQTTEMSITIKMIKVITTFPPFLKRKLKEWYKTKINSTDYGTS